MVDHTRTPKTLFLRSFLRGGLSLTFLFLLIEFFDELNYGIGNAALPALRTDLGLTYAQVGLLLGLPHVINSFIEPALMLLGDTHWRKHIVTGGGLAIVLSLVLIATAHSFPLILAAMIIGFPASGAFVTLSQATLMDLNPGREAHMMARWTASGSVANLVGPLFLAAGFALGFGWRWAFFALAGLCLVLVLIQWPNKFPTHPHSEALQGSAQHSTQQLRGILSGLWEALRNRSLLRWMALLQFSDLLLDVLTGYLPLYFTDVSGFSIAQASLLLSVLMGAGLISNLALIPLLERMPGRTVVRWSSAATLLIYPLFLLLPWVWAKIGLAVLLKLVTLGWYEVLQGEAYASVPGRSGTVMAIGSLSGILGGLIIGLVGWVAEQAGLPAAMWLLLAGPLILLLFVPRFQKGSPE
jgi:FSR family fosmidomycin resistance protein-like MFS transporter